MTHVRVAIVGSGFGGLGTAIRLKQDGIDDFLIFEKSDDLGGTWRDNSYPGCACDVPSHLYSYSFALNPDWSRSFSGQAEIWAYLRRCVERFGLERHLRFGHEVRAADWDEAAQRWRIETARGTFTADAVVAAAGPLSEPATPDLPGLESFAGAVFHSARWDHDLDLTDRKVAVIGTGASAVQFVPVIQPKVDRLRLFQRTPPWIVPRGDRALTKAERALYRTVPLAQRLVRLSIFLTQEFSAVGFLNPRLLRLAQRVPLRHLRRSVPDPELRARLVPEYTMGCKRVLRSDDYLPALTQPNVDVVTAGIREVTPTGIVTADGVEHPVDTIIFGTGFHVTDPPIGDTVRGRDGRSLAEVWQGSPEAYLGTSVAGFPNLFLLLGPSTGLGHTSVVYMIEAQLRYVLDALRYLRRDDVSSVEPTPDAQREFRTEVDRRMRTTVWASGCDSWYIDGTGRNSTIWPSFATAFRHRLRRFDPRRHLISAPAGHSPGRVEAPSEARP
jgi:cation diffusion facilitator CzcD-associated flavoprotein CzcO